MQRRKREAESRRHPAVPKNSIKSTVGFVVRIHTGRHASDEIKSELRKLNLNKKYEAIFVNLNEEKISKFEIRIFIFYFVLANFGSSCILLT